MKQIVNLALRTEYSFKQTFGKLSEILQHDNKTGAIGIADINNTFAHVKFEKMCVEAGVKPIFGARLMVTEKPEEKVRGRWGPEYIFIAKNYEGFKELNELVKTAHDKFYYKAQIGIDDMLAISSNVYVICECPAILDRLDFIALTPSTPRMMAGFDIPKLAINTNRYSTPEEKQTYQLLAGARKMGKGYNYMFNDQTYPQHILSTAEWYRIWKDESAIDNTHLIADSCSVEIPSASMVRFDGPQTVEQLSIRGALRKGVDLDESPYKERYEREMGLINDKSFADYFLITADMIEQAKKKMLVGPARGSSAGSLVCYLLDITSVDPIEHGLLFERFIDVNRMDLPDIDVDFPDTKRQGVIKQLIKKFSASNVCHIANINKLKAKSAIGEFAMALSIPKYEVEAVKDSIVDRSGGDARAAVAAMDTLMTTEVGKEFIEKYPAMKLVEGGEGHARHAGVHAAGIIVCNDPISNFGGVNSRDNVIMMDKKDAEAKNLLKIDVLGLRTLSVLEECADLIGMKYSEYYDLPTDDQDAFKVLQDMRISGIFQFEGQAMQMLCKQMGVETFNDIVALTALARPGPLHSGAAGLYIKRRTGEEEIEYVSEHPMYIQETEDTQGVIVYQEQLMNICRNCGNMSWSDVSGIRKAASKSLGKEYFDRYRSIFLKGAVDENEIDEDEAIEIWENMLTFGSWGMNKSHSVSYGYISYWCCYMKAHHPLEFAAANLNHAKSDDSALKMLRDVTSNEGIEYIPVDADESLMKWSIHDGKLLGGLLNISGIGDKKAKDLLTKRKMGIAPTPAMIKKLIDPKTPFDVLYPCQHFFGDYYDNFREAGLTRRAHYIDEIETEEGEYVFLGKIIDKDLRDLNEYNELVKRGGKVLHENNLFLRLVVEDDTNQILCKINRFEYEKMNGNYWLETLLVDKSYVIIRGTMRGGWRVVDIKAMHYLGVPQ